MQLLLRFFAERNLIEVVSGGRKHPDAKYGIPTQIRARQGLIDYLDQDDASPAERAKVSWNKHPNALKWTSAIRFKFLGERAK